MMINELCNSDGVFLNCFGDDAVVSILEHTACLIFDDVLAENWHLWLSAGASAGVSAGVSAGTIDEVIC